MENRIVKEAIVCSGALFYAKSTRRFLLLQKASGKHEGTWGLVGGTNITGETPWQGLQREISEEIGKTPAIKKIVPLELFTSNDQQFQYNTYILIVEKEFIPTLNEEHSGYAWCDLNSWPKPLHQGVKTSLNSRSIRTKIELLLELI